MRYRGFGLTVAPRYLCERLLRGLERLRTDVLCTVGKSMFVHRTKGEEVYLEAVRAIPDESLQACHVVSFVDPAAWVWSLSQLRIEFRYFRKNVPYGNVFCKNERWFRAKHGVPCPTSVSPR